MSDTVYCLTYQKFSPDITDFAEAGGPFLFGRKEAAQDHLLDIVIGSICDFYLVEFTKIIPENILSKHGMLVCNECVQDIHVRELSYKYAEGPFSFERLIRWYTDTVKNDGGLFTYSIEKMPTLSFFEQLEKAKAIIINGILNEFTLDRICPYDKEEILIVCNGINPETREVEQVIFNFDELSHATFDSSTSAWKVDEYIIRFI